MKIGDFKFDSSILEKEQLVEAPACCNCSAVQNKISLNELFRTVFSSAHSKVAFADDGLALSFDELDNISCAVANFILQQDYGYEAAVGVLCTRGSLFLAAGLGILRSGAVYIPVEKELPLARQEIMLAPVKLLLTDSSCLREAEYFKFKNSGIRHIVCLDSPQFEAVIERGAELNSTAFWEHVAANGSDQGWKSFIDGKIVSSDVLKSLAANIINKSGLRDKKQKRVLDIGSGSGIVAEALLDVADSYSAVELARNELDRIERRNNPHPVKVHQMEAVDICFLEGEEFDFINLTGVVENFPGYNYLRRVLSHGVDKLSAEGTLFIGAVWDLDKKDAFRKTLKEHASRSGNNRGLLRFDVCAELFLPESFFTQWAAESKVPVEISISRPEVGCKEISDYRFDVVITKKSVAETSAVQTRFGSDYLYSLPAVELPDCKPEQAAYIVYTSGSTGTPKGVVVEHRNLIDILSVLKEYSKDCARVSLVAPLSFDASIQQLALSFFCGKFLYIHSDEQRKSPEKFFNSIVKRRIDLCDMTPAFFNVLVDYLFEHKLSLPVKKVLLAGEILRPDTIQKFYSLTGNKNVVLYNVYGPTECTVDTTTFRIDFNNYDRFSAYPIGTPFEGSTITIRDKEGRVVPDTLTGEIWISGAGVSRGYLNTENDGAFVQIDGQRSYRTGDYGFRKNGLVYYVGRYDQQVKIRGNRVEIGEVENIISGFPGVRQVVVVADNFRSGDEKCLAAYVVGDIEVADLKKYLEQLLPLYCVPDFFVPMLELPLSVNRKVDKKALPSPKDHKINSNGRKLFGPVEEKMAVIWKKLLGVDVSDADANFFSLGGHSILAIRLIAMIDKELGLHVSLAELFSHPTIAKLSELFAGKKKIDNSPVIKICQGAGDKSIFLFHPIGGSVFCYSELANLLGHEYSVYAVEAAGFSPEKNSLNTELHRVEDLADYYLSEILKVESEGIIFGGWSFGGLVAYEAACRYDKLGYSSGDVLILDSLADNAESRQVVAKDDVGLLKSILQDSMSFDENKLRSLPREKKLDYLIECGENAGMLPSGFSSVQMDNLLQTYRSNAIAAARYEHPTRSTKRILLIRAMEFAENSQWFNSDKYLGWSKFLNQDDISLKWTSGTHENMLSPGLVGNVAKHILEYLSHD